MALDDRTSQKHFQSRTNFKHTKYLQYTELCDVYVERTFERCLCLCSVGKPEGKGPFARRNHRREDNTINGSAINPFGGSRMY